MSMNLTCCVDLLSFYFRFSSLLNIMNVRFFLSYVKPFAKWSMKLEEVPKVFDGSIDKFLLQNKSTSSKGTKGKGKVLGPTPDDIRLYCADAKISEDVVNQYIWDKRRYETTQTKISKFVEALWRFIFYSMFCVMGIKGLFYDPVTVSWISDTQMHWVNWPFLQPGDQLPFLLKFYYVTQLGCYIHQLYWTEVARKDAVEMIIHHCATILLISFSWLANFTRVGCSILLVHDLADIFLESGKCVSYASKAKGNEWLGSICDSLFATFAVTFGITRLYLYPNYLVLSLLVESPSSLNPTGETPWVGFWIFSALLTTLQILHIFWFYTIMKMVVQLFTTGIDGDVRSEDEDEAAEPKDTKKGK